MGAEHRLRICLHISKRFVLFRAIGLDGRHLNRVDVNRDNCSRADVSTPPPPLSAPELQADLKLRMLHA